MHPSIALIRDLYDYDAHTGFLINRVHRSNNSKTGARAGTLTCHGYRLVRLDGKQWREHRIIWIWVYGSLDLAMDIDHINGVKDDNRIENLRLATRSENMRNMPVTRRNQCGHKGVSWSASRGKWRAEASCHGVRRFSLHETQEEAIQAAVLIRAELHGSFASSGV